MIGLLVPSNDPGLNLKVKNAAASPFVIAIQHAGIKALPSVRTVKFTWASSVQLIYFGQIINACLLTSAWSAASSDLYTSSRVLCKSFAGMVLGGLVRLIV